MPDLRTLQGLQPEVVWKMFEEISNIPRCSKHEEKILAYLVNFARARNLDFSQDAIGNIVLRKEGTNGSSEPLVLQSHVDMVCEKNSSVKKNMLEETIDLVHDGEWVRAEGTTLGADNGIGLAMMLAVLDGTAPHPPLEALFTVDEESALVGACALDPSLITAKRLINIDSDRQDYFCIGAAGGQTTVGLCPVAWEEPPADYRYVQLSLKGLRGGHSGVMIHEGRGNSVKMLFRMLASFPDSLRVFSLEAGGERHNAIPREAAAGVALPAAVDVEKSIAQLQDEFASEYGTQEANLALEYSTLATPSRVLTRAATQSLIRTVLTIPDGPLSMSRNFEGVVESSSNLAGAWIRNDGVHILTSQRALFEHLIDYASATITAAIVQGGGEAVLKERFPCWPPLPDSGLQRFMTEVFTELRGRAPTIEIVHAGLECGAIRQRVGELDAISMGIRIEEAHSPGERVNIATVEATWKFLLEVLRLMR